MNTRKAAIRAAQKALHKTSFLWRREEGRLFRHLKSLFLTLDIETAIDAGANRGRYIELLRTCVGFSGRIIAIEPIPENTDKIRKQMQYDSDIVLYQIALGRENTTQSLNITRHNAMSSFRTPIQSGIDRLGRLNDVVQKINVETRTVDSLVDEIFADGKAQNTFLKLDTQGADLDILAGAQRFLPNVTGLQIEIPFAPIYQDLPPASKYFQMIERCGFALTGIYPVHVLSDGRIVDVDAVFRRV